MRSFVSIVIFSIAMVVVFVAMDQNWLGAFSGDDGLGIPVLLGLALLAYLLFREKGEKQKEDQSVEYPPLAGRRHHMERWKHPGH